MDNKTMNPSYTCEGCLYDDEECTYNLCTNCARNNLSGYYEDLYVRIPVYDDFPILQEHKPLTIGSNLFDKDCDFYHEGAVKMGSVKDYFECRDLDGNLHKATMIPSPKEGILWEIFIYDEIIEG